MSRTRKGSKYPGYEFWGRRDPAGGYGPVAKLITHRKERRRDRRMAYNAKTKLVSE